MRSSRVLEVILRIRSGLNKEFHGVIYSSWLDVANESVSSHMILRISLLYLGEAI